MKPYTRPHSWRQATIRLPGPSAAYATWRVRVKAWERREAYRVNCAGLGDHTAAAWMGVTPPTIRRWRKAIAADCHTHPGPWPGLR